MRGLLRAITWIAEAGEIARPGAAGIDQRRHRASARKGLRIDAERRAARIDMGMQVDQPRGHQMTGDIAFGAALQALTHHRDMTVGEGHIGDAVDACDGSMTRPPRKTKSCIAIESIPDT